MKFYTADNNLQWYKCNLQSPGPKFLDIFCGVKAATAWGCPCFIKYLFQRYKVSSHHFPPPSLRPSGRGLNQLKYISRSASELLLRRRKIALVRLFLTRIKPILVLLFFVGKLVLS
jgi:hypothetical protein